MQEQNISLKAVLSAFMTPFFLGVAPVFGKMGMNAGADPFTVAALRTVVAVLILWGAYLIFFRRFIYIYPAGLLGCVVIGTVNGIGSLFFYAGLGTLDAGLTQLLNGMYVVFAVILVRLGGEVLDRRVIVRVLLSVAGLMIVAGFGSEAVDFTGVGLMLGSALMFAGTMILSQYVLSEMPSPTAALYILTTMAILVLMVWLASGGQQAPMDVGQAVLPIVILGLTTALSRLAMFAGVKFLGSMQTAILAIGEIIVALLFAFVLLGERLTVEQWLGVSLMLASILLVRTRDLRPSGFNPGRLVLANLASQQFQHIAFHRAFAKGDPDKEDEVMDKLTTMEIKAIQEMMGVGDGHVDPFPINPAGQYSVDLSIFRNLADQDDDPARKQ